MKKTTVTIGIPAYNEEQNILHTIECVLAQVQESYVLEEVIVSSDGSTDKTAELVRALENNKITLIENKNRGGLAENQNKIFSATTSEILVLIQADTHIADNYFIEKMISPIIERKADLTSPSLTALSPRTYFEKILNVSMLFKNDIFNEINKGNNIYTCHGPARAFSKSLYSTLRFTESVGEDAYTYAFSITKGYKYIYVPETEILYRLPDNFKDHEKQSVRVFHAQESLSDLFESKTIRKMYTVPVATFVKWLGVYLILYPLEMMSYLAIVSFIKFKSFGMNKTSNNWEISASSKSLFKHK